MAFGEIVSALVSLECFSYLDYVSPDPALRRPRKAVDRALRRRGSSSSSIFVSSVKYSFDMYYSLLVGFYLFAATQALPSSPRGQVDTAKLRKRLRMSPSRTVRSNR